jgi:hypothetical protein
MIIYKNIDIIITHGLKRLPFHFITDIGVLQISYFKNKRTRIEKILTEIKCGNSKGVKIDGRFISYSELDRRKFPATKVFIKKEIMPF